MSDLKQLSRILEGAIFASERPLSISDLLTLFEDKKQPEKKELRDALDLLMEQYAEGGVELKELANGFQFQVRADLSEWVQKLWEEKPARYSKAFLETLALVAYRQPITRGEIGEVRGVVVSSNIIRTLMERDWIRIVGFRDVPGKPGLYATTKKFLDDFGLKSLKELPELPEVEAIMQLEAGMSQETLESVETSEEIEESDETLAQMVESVDAAFVDVDSEILAEEEMDSFETPVFEDEI